MPIVLHSQLPVQEPYPKARQRTIASKDLGAASVTVLDVTLEAGGQIPMHIHPTHEEAVLILEGTADAVIENETRTVKGGATMLVPAGKKHQVVNRSNQPVRILAVFPTTDVKREWVT